MPQATYRMSYAFVKDRFLPADEASVPIASRGFRFGDGVFETIAVEEGVPVYWERHAARLKQGCDILRLPVDAGRLQELGRELIVKNRVRSGILRLSVSRGEGGSGYLPDMNALPLLVIETLPMPSAPPVAISLYLSNYRKTPQRSLPVQAKLMQGLNSTLARMEAADRGCFDALMLGADGQICETSSANIFWLKGGMLYTPATDCGLLPGVARSIVLDVAPMAVQEGCFTLRALQEAEEVFVTNAVWGVLPVNRLDPFGYQWQPGAGTKAVADAFRNDRRAYIAHRLSAVV